MARYIDEENLIRRMHTMAKDKNYPPYADIFKSFAFKVFKDLLISEPTADVQEVKHGKWTKDVSKRRGDGEIYDYMCNICGTPAIESEHGNCDVFLAYCPWCGAKMDGKENG